MTRRILLQSFVLLLALSSILPVVLADGGKAKNVIYEAQVRPRSGTGSFQFTHRYQSHHFLPRDGQQQIPLLVTSRSRGKR
jgi:hypothetical protein